MSAHKDEHASFDGPGLNPILVRVLIGILVLTVFGLTQEPILVNLQLLWKTPRLFPEFGSDGTIFDKRSA
jgi:hypothetical protein